jgi:hypothetical protein
MGEISSGGDLSSGWESKEEGREGCESPIRILNEGGSSQQMREEPLGNGYRHAFYTEA